MDKLTAILVAIIALVLILPLLTITVPYSEWIVALAVVVIAINALIKEFKK